MPGLQETVVVVIMSDMPRHRRGRLPSRHPHLVK